MKLNSKNTKFVVGSRTQTIAPDYGDLTLGVAMLEEVKSLHILEISLHSKLTFETLLWEVVSKLTRSLRGRASSKKVI